MPRSQAKMKPGYQDGGFVTPPNAYGYRPPVAPRDEPQPRAPAHHTIGPAPSPGMSANAQNVMRGIMSQPTRDWGSAVSKIANAFITRRNDMKAQEADRSLAQAKDERRAGWAPAHSAKAQRSATSPPPIRRSSEPRRERLWATRNFSHFGSSHNRRRLDRNPSRTFLTPTGISSRNEARAVAPSLIHWPPEAPAPDPGPLSPAGKVIADRRSPAPRYRAPSHAPARTSTGSRAPG